MYAIGRNQHQTDNSWPNVVAFAFKKDNAIIGIPCRGFADSGVPRWDASAAYVAIPEIIAGKKKSIGDSPHRAFGNPLGTGTPSKTRLD